VCSSDLYRHLFTDVEDVPVPSTAPVPEADRLTRLEQRVAALEAALRERAADKSEA
jgi:hypothetical protein